jgi:hypothetical protein
VPSLVSRRSAQAYSSSATSTNLMVDGSSRRYRTPPHCRVRWRCGEPMTSVTRCDGMRNEGSVGIYVLVCCLFICLFNVVHRRMIQRPPLKSPCSAWKEVGLLPPSGWELPGSALGSTKLLVICWKCAILE